MNEHDEAYRDALRACGARYTFMAPDDLAPFVREFICEVDEGYPLVKLNRWLGYIQGVLVERGITTVEAERDWTRPHFQPLDFGSACRFTVRPVGGSGAAAAYCLTHSMFHDSPGVRV